MTELSNKESVSIHRGKLRLVKGLVLFTVVLTGSITVSLLTVIVVLKFDPALDAAAKSLVLYAENKLPVTIKIDRVSGDFLRDLSIYGIRIASDDSTVVTIDQLSLNYKLPSLLTGDIRITDLTARGMALTVSRNADGAWNIPRFQPSGNPGRIQETISQRLSVTVDRLRVVGRSLTINTSSGTTIDQFHARNIKLDSHLRISSTRMDLRITEFSVDRPPTQAPVVVRGLISYDPDEKKITIDRGVIESGDSHMTLLGSLSNAGNQPRIKADAVVKSLAFNDLPSAWRPPVSLDSATGEFGFHGTLDRLAYDARAVSGKTTAYAEGTLTFDYLGRIGLNARGAIHDFDPSVLEIPRLSVDGSLSVDFDFHGKLLNSDRRTAVLDATLQTGSIGAYAFESGGMAVGFDGDDIAIRKVRLKTGFGDIVGSLTCLNAMDSASEKKIALTLGASNLDIAKLRPTFEEPTDINAELVAEITLPASLEPASITSRFDLKVLPSTVRGVTLNHGSLNGRWDGNRFIVNNAALDSTLGSAQVTGTIDRDSHKVDLEIGAAISHGRPVINHIAKYHGPLNRTLQMIAEIDGSLEIDGHVRGDWAEPVVDVTVKISEFVWRDYRAQAARIQLVAPSLKRPDDVRFEIHGDGVGYREFRVQSTSAMIKIGADNIDFALGVFGDCDERIEIAGNVSAWRQATKRVTLTKMNAELNKVMLSGTTPTAIIVANDEISIDPITFESLSSKLTISGAINLAGTGELSYQMKNLDLSVANEFLTPEHWIAGVLSGEGVVTGQLDAPVITGSLTVDDFGYRDFSVDSASVSHHSSDLPPTTANIVLKGSVLCYGAHEISNPDVTVGLTPDTVVFDTSFIYGGLGRIALRGTADGWQTPMQTILLTDASWERESLKLTSIAPFKVNRSQNRIAIVDSLALESNSGANGAIEGFIDIESGALDFQGEVEGLALVSIHDVAPFLGNIEGVGKVDLRISNNLSQPIAEINVKIADGRFYGQPLSLVAGKANYANGLTVIDLKAEIDNRHAAALNGDAAVDFSLRPLTFKVKPNALNLHAEIRNARLSRLPIHRQSGVTIDGNVNLNLNITGDSGNPEIAGTASVTDGILEFEELGLTYETVTLDSTITHDRITINRLIVAGDNEGTMQVQGEVTLAGATIDTVTLSLAGDNLYIPYKQAIRAHVRPDLTLRGTPDDLSLTGRITVLDSRISIDSLSNESASEITVIGLASDSRVLSVSDRKRSDHPMFDNLSAAVEIAIPKNTWIKGQDMNIELQGDLLLRKESRQPFHLIGPLQTRRGDYYFQGKLFKIAKGEATFIGLDQPDPILDIQAVTSVKNVEIMVLIGGSLRDMRLSLESDPVMDTPDIISYLVFGQPMDSIQNQQAFNSERAALRLTGELAAHELRNIIGEVKLIDTFSMNLGDDDSGGSISLGKYVTPNVVVTFQRGFTAADPRFMQVNYSINRFLQIEAQIGDEKNDGVDVIWDFEF